MGVCIMYVDRSEYLRREPKEWKRAETAVVSCGWKWKEQDPGD